ncbi:hypothetical protein [Desulfofustis limnaeus]|uniref:Uncharacterized protein n=1 Tax=Desulfofustis limnaeus TaxID=2740163 RepID=A0ABM7W5Q8_9BACT|nr:hypothetical protein [Desulfofustis limnaeus]MDX9895119.1 hypothetical protein [Desulfofustis sp.]BDD86286.1 hypothetical protein DPPLL_06510 [Desulfofustis limnaeus]
MIRRSIGKIASTSYVRSAIEEPVDLSAFKEKPTPRAVAGLAVIGLSYLIGWPAIGLLGIVSVQLREPVLAAVGGPVLYGLSHLVFLLGMYLCGSGYAGVMCRWLTRISMERLLAWARVRDWRD